MKANIQTFTDKRDGFAKINLAKFTFFFFFNFMKPQICSFFWFLGFVLLKNVSFAQLNNQIFVDSLSIQPKEVHKLYLQVQNLNFVKNNEYFNDIIPGQTFFGYQLKPRFVYFAAKNVRVDAGMYVLRDFGKEQFTRVAPVFSVKFQKSNTSLTLGTLQGNLAHRLVEPMYDFDRVLTNRLENGLQIMHNGQRWYLDLWVDWQQAIDRGAPLQEEIFGGLHTYYKIINKPYLTIQIPLQFTILHQGGQEAFIAKPILNTMNLATGLQIHLGFHKTAFIQSIKLDNYVLGSQAAEVTIGQPDFDNGQAFYGNLTFETKWGDLMTSLWLGDRFNSAQGGGLYRSTGVSDKTFTERHRDLLLVRYLRNFNISEYTRFTIRIEPSYDFNSQEIEAAIGLYVHFNPKFFLKKISLPSHNKR
ncbi:hypothetical protein BKI52_42860 [marine bacterium AO1-C]|nr:hypothetical protein BKI52_42860 [marine bacterium AO1-C]